jgi:hypothetical protein
MISLENVDGNVMITECKPILKFCARTTLETTLGHLFGEEVRN